jgi:hypothetical protein
MQLARRYCFYAKVSSIDMLPLFRKDGPFASLVSRNAKDTREEKGPSFRNRGSNFTW